MGIGENIKKYRKRAGFTQKELANKISISENSIRRYELEQRKPSVEIIQKIVDVLNVDFFEIVNGIDIDIEKDAELENKKKLDNIVLSIEKTTAIKKWQIETDLRVLLKDIIINNKDLKEFHKNIKLLSELYFNEFNLLSQNNPLINSSDLNAEKIRIKNINSLNAVCKIQESYVDNIVTKIITLINMEDSTINALLDYKNNRK